jgi:hypothetical protein
MNKSNKKMIYFNLLNNHFIVKNRIFIFFDNFSSISSSKVFLTISQLHFSCISGNNDWLIESKSCCSRFLHVHRFESLPYCVLLQFRSYSIVMVLFAKLVKTNQLKLFLFRANWPSWANLYFPNPDCCYLQFELINLGRCSIESATVPCTNESLQRSQFYCNLFNYPLTKRQFFKIIHGGLG